MKGRLEAQGADRNACTDAWVSCISRSPTITVGVVVAR